MSTTVDHRSGARPGRGRRSPLAKLLSPLLLMMLKARIAFVTAVAAESGPASCGYQRTLDEDRWVMEEEYHGASSSLSTDDRHGQVGQKATKQIPGNRDDVGDDRRGTTRPPTSWFRRLSPRSRRRRASGSNVYVDDEEYDWVELLEKDDDDGIRERLNRREKRNRKTRIGEGRRRSLSSSSFESDDDDVLGAAHDCDEAGDEEEEHPMRTDEWSIDVRVSRLFPPSESEWFPECAPDGAPIGLSRGAGEKHKHRSKRRRRQVMRFAQNGYVLLVEDEGCQNSGGSGNQSEGDDVVASSSDAVTVTQTNHPRRKRRAKIGKWRMDHTGIAFDIPVRALAGSRTGNGSRCRPLRRSLAGISDGNTAFASASGGADGEERDAAATKRTVLHYHADIHLNKFGERPRMFRGVVTRDRHCRSSFLPPHLFRPVIATFTAEGIGKDTADVSYKDRGFGLTGQPPPSS